MGTPVVHYLQNILRPCERGVKGWVDCGHKDMIRVPEAGIVPIVGIYVDTRVCLDFVVKRFRKRLELLELLRIRCDVFVGYGWFHKAKNLW